MEQLVEKINTNIKPADHEYVGEDGLLHCSVCHRPTQVKVEFSGIKKIVRCICDCRKAELEREANRQRMDETEIRRRECFAQTNMKDWTFENDDRRSEKLSGAMIRYSENFPDFLKDGQGLLLHGVVGTGKTYYAACIANHVIDQGYRVFMTSFLRITNQIQGMNDDKQKYIDNLNRYHLLVLDDLGAERNTEFMQEMVYNIVDTRYRAGLPLIVTTNLTGEQIAKAQDITYQRIYDRILERCFPVAVEGSSRRRAKLKETHGDMKKMLGL